MRRKKNVVTFSVEPLGFREFWEYVDFFNVVNNREWNEYAGAKVFFHQPHQSPEKIDLDKVDVSDSKTVFPLLYSAGYLDYSIPYPKFSDQLCEVIGNSGRTFLPSGIVTALFKKGCPNRNDYELVSVMPSNWYKNTRVAIPLLGIIYEVERRWYGHGETQPMRGKFCLCLQRYYGDRCPYWTVTAFCLYQRAIDGCFTRILTIG